VLSRLPVTSQWLSALIPQPILFCWPQFLVVTTESPALSSDGLRDQRSFDPATAVATLLAWSGHQCGAPAHERCQHGATYKDLVYVRRRYVTVDQLRRAVAIVINGTLSARNLALWGEGTTACASDSRRS
jgi:hypothetical protein